MTWHGPHDADPALAEVAEQMAGYLDGELDAAERERMRQHLQDCAPCRRELRTQVAVRRRLMRERDPMATDGLRARIRSAMAGDPAAGPSRWGRLRTTVAWGGWAAAAGLGGLLLLRRPATPLPAGGMSMSMGPPVPVLVDSLPSPVVDSVLRDFQRVAAGELPATANLQALESGLPFSVPALRSPHMRLIATWTDSIQGEPVGVIAYRCHDRLVVQYVVSEQQFFRHPEIRAAIARAGLYAAGRGAIHAVAWPGRDNGSLLVGEFAPSDLAAMRS